MMDRLTLLWQYFRAGRRFRRWSTREELVLWQEDQVLKHLKRVAAHSSFFNSRADKYGLTSWAHWPHSGKKEMMVNFDAWNTAGIALADAWPLAMEAEQSRDFSKTLTGITVGMSSGTSSSRGVFLVSEMERRIWAGTLLSRVLRGTLLRQHRAALFLRADSPLYQTVGSRRFQFSFFDLFQPVESLWPKLCDFRPTVLAAPPGVLARLAAFPGAGQLLAHPCILLSVADVLDDREKQVIEEGFGQPVGQIYQATEGFLAATCPYGKLHWNEDAIIVHKEWLDAEQSRYVPVITDFRRFTQPIIRYRLDDIIVAGEESPCACGSVFETLERIEGRSDDVLYLRRKEREGQLTLFPDFVRRAMMLALPDGVDYTVEQVSLERWQVSLSRDCPVETVRREVNSLCEKLGGRTPELEFCAWHEVEAHRKRRRVRRRSNVLGDQP